jgi:hypothetical protein
MKTHQGFPLSLKTTATKMSRFSHLIVNMFSNGGEKKSDKNVSSIMKRKREERSFGE